MCSPSALQTTTEEGKSVAHGVSPRPITTAGMQESWQAPSPVNSTASPATVDDPSSATTVADVITMMMGQCRRDILRMKESERFFGACVIRLGELREDPKGPLVYNVMRLFGFWGKWHDIEKLIKELKEFHEVKLGNSFPFPTARESSSASSRRVRLRIIGVAVIVLSVIALFKGWVTIGG